MEDLLEGDVEGRIRKQRPADRREEQMTREVERQYELISAQKATAEASKPTEIVSAATIEQEGLLSDAQAADDTKEISVAPLYRGVASGDIRTGGVIDVDGKASESRESFSSNTRFGDGCHEHRQPAQLHARSETSPVSPEHKRVRPTIEERMDVESRALGVSRRLDVDGNTMVDGAHGKRLRVSHFSSRGGSGKCSFPAGRVQEVMGR